MSRLWSWLVPEGEGALKPHALLFLALITLALHVPGQIGVPVMDRDEARYAQATRQMFESGNFIDIKFADQDRYLQPVGIYWLQAAAAFPFGGAKAPIWAFRLPSLLAALGGVLLTAWFGARLYGPRVGMSAGLILAPSLLLTMEAHFAKIDSTLLFVTLVAMIALHQVITRPVETKRRFIGWPLVFWFALGIGGLLKGPIILLIVGLAVIAYGIWQREWRYLWRDLKPYLGIVIVAAIVAPWLIAINQDTGGAFFQHAMGHSFGYKIAHGEQSHGQPPGYHTLLFMVTFFPGIVLAGLAAASAWRGRADKTVRFLLCWIVPTWLMFEIVATKLPHYVLPVFPAIALLAAIGLRDAAEIKLSRLRWLHWLFGALFLIAACAVTALPIVAARQLEGAVTPLAVIASVFNFLVLVAGVMLWLKLKPEWLLATVFATVLGYFVTLQLLIPSFDRLWVSDRLARVASNLSGCQTISVSSAGYTEPSIVFHFGSKTLLGDGKAAAQHLAAHPGCGIAIVESREKRAFLSEADAEGVAVQRFGSASGVNYVNGDDITLDIYGTDTSALEIPGSGREELDDDE